MSTNEKIKKVWTDPVWSKVIATGILVPLSAIAAYLLNWWPVIKPYGEACYKFALASSIIPNWISFLVVLLAIPTVIVWGIALSQKLVPRGSTSPSWKSYLSDAFVGLRWRWKYYNDEGGIYDLHSFCPHCDFQVYPQNASAYSAIDRIGFYCDSCHKSLGEHDESYDSLESKINRFIHQKIRNGSWDNKT